MDFIIYLSLIVLTIILFILAYEWGNPFIYIGIMLICITGLLLSIDTTATYTLGEINKTVTGNVTIESPITYPLATLNNLGFILYFIMGIMGSVIIWALDKPKT